MLDATKLPALVSDYHGSVVNNTTSMETIADSLVQLTSRARLQETLLQIADSQREEDRRRIRILCFLKRTAEPRCYSDIKAGCVKPPDRAMNNKLYVDLVFLRDTGLIKASAAEADAYELTDETEDLLDPNGLDLCV
jgi:hypothetical protein